MIGYDHFSALRLRHMFPRNVLDAAQFYIEVPDDGPDDFDESYQGGSWCSEVIDGVSLWYPKRAGSRVGIMQIAACPYPDASKVGGQPFTGPFVEPAWAANADVALAVLGCGLRIGAKLDGLRPLAVGEVQVTDFSDGARHFISLASRSPDLYHLHGIVHDREGLIFLEVRRPDLIRRNEYEKGGYNECNGAMFDEGIGGGQDTAERGVADRPRLDSRSFEAIVSM